MHKCQLITLLHTMLLNSVKKNLEISWLKLFCTKHRRPTSSAFLRNNLNPKLINYRKSIPSGNYKLAIAVMSSESREFKYDVVVVGSILMDLVCYSDRLPKPGETIGGNDFKTGFGGKGANQCVAAARLGARTAFIGKVGDDSNGHSYYNNLKAEGVSVEGTVQIEPNVPTGVASIMVGANDGQNMIITVAGANGLITPAYVTGQGEALMSSTKIMLCQMEIPTEATFEALRLARKFSAISIFNVAPATVIPKEMLQLADILCVNETEAEMICGVPNIQNVSQAKLAIQTLVDEFGCNSVIITLGPEGALLWDQVEYHYEAAPPIPNVVDTTGAGDCFIGVLAYCLSQDETLVAAFKAAVRNASESVRTKGTQSSFPHKLVHD